MYFKIRYLQNSQEKYLIIEADNFINAINKFKEKRVGIFLGAEEVDEPFEVKVKKLKEKLKTLLEPSKIDMEEYISILEQMYVMLDASLSINSILEEIEQNVKNYRLKVIISSLKHDVESGLSLSISVKKFEKDLGKLSIAMIELGEQTGMLAEAFRDLANILLEIQKNRERLKSATRYPVFILMAMAVAFSVVILFVIPPFKSIFAQLGSDLPFATKMLLWAEHFLETFGLYILSLGIIAAVGVNYLYKKYDKVRYMLDKFLLKVYIVGDVIEYAMLGRFLYSFERLTTAGVPLMDALDTALGVIDNFYMKEQLLKIKSSIAEGRGLASGFSESKLFENMIVQMISSGENSGNLSRMLEKATNYYRSKYLNIVDNISTLIEPILIAGIAGFVATLAFGIFMPMWSMASAMQGK